MGCRDVPDPPKGTRSHDKNIPKSFQQTSKLGSIGLGNSGFITNFHVNGTVAGCAAHWIYIYPPPCLQAYSACLIQCKICNLLRKKGVEDSLLLRGNRSQEPFPYFHRMTFSDLVFKLFFPPPFSCAFAPKHSPNGHPKSVKNLTNR